MSPRSSETSLSRAGSLVARARRAVVAPSVPWTYFVARPYAPLLAQVVVTRRCNLKCAYCTEYDRVSDPVPLARLQRTVDLLAALGTRAIAFTGGEPTLHPDLVALVRHAAASPIAKVTMITNGYKLTPDLIDALGAAGLTRMQLSLDGVEPNATTAKVLRCTEPKLRLLAERARFAVHVNAVLGSIPPAETVQIVELAASLGLEATVQWLHGPDGQALNPHGVTAAEVRAIEARARRPDHHAASVARSGLGAQSWKCRAGSRYLYVDEHSTARFCSQARDLWSKPIDDVTDADLQHNFHTPKPCASHCTLGCVRDASQYDGWRPQRGTP